MKKKTLKIIFYRTFQHLIKSVGKNNTALADDHTLCVTKKKIKLCSPAQKTTEYSVTHPVKTKFAQIEVKNGQL